MDDRSVMRGFVHEAARRAFGPNLHIEGDALFFAGWWQMAFRIAPGTFILRNEDTPDESTVIQEMAEELATASLETVGYDLPMIYPITYTEFTLPTGSWSVWSDSLSTAETALAERAGVESFLTDAPGRSESNPPVALSPELGGARRIGGLAPSVVLTIGVPQDTARHLEAALPECRLISKAFGDITPDGCGTLIPTLLVVDAAEPMGLEFIMEHRAAACGRFTPVVALTPATEVPLGADVAIHPDLAVIAGADAIRSLLP